jgi:hypothetical protein
MQRKRLGAIVATTAVAVLIGAPCLWIAYQDYLFNRAMVDGEHRGMEIARQAAEQEERDREERLDALREWFTFKDKHPEDRARAANRLKQARLDQEKRGGENVKQAWEHDLKVIEEEFKQAERTP